MFKFLRIVCFVFSGFLFFACTKDEVPPVLEYEKESGVFIINEGNFTYGNASLSFFDYQKNEISDQVFYNTNGFPLGDVAYSMKIKGNLGYIVVNNSGKIFVINATTFKHESTIADLVSPRHIQFISETKAYVSDLYSPQISILDLTNYTVSGHILIGNSTEQMVQHTGFVYATSWSFNDKLYKIDASQDKLVDSLTVAKQPNSIVLDKNNKLWVLSDGGIAGTPFGQENAELVRVNPVNMAIEKRFVFSSLSDSPSGLKLNSTKDTLFFINGGWQITDSEKRGIYKMPVTSDVFPKNPIIPEGQKLFYSLGIEPVTSTIYISDAIDYMQKGFVYRYTSSGTKIDSFKVGIIPGAFCFKTD